MKTILVKLNMNVLFAFIIYKINNICVHTYNIYVFNKNK